MSRYTISVIKADVGSIGGHTKPSDTMIKECDDILRNSHLFLDNIVTYTGDDICFILCHQVGVGNSAVHNCCWSTFKRAADIAAFQGLYGAGQDLLVDAPSGNIRGAGPAVAEIEFETGTSDRQAEAFLVMAADKCGPGVYNLPLYQTFCDPMHDGGILLNPKMHKGFKFTIIDMDCKEGDRVIELNAPEDIWDIAALLRDTDRYAVEAIHSRYKPSEQIVSVSATRLHNIAGKYTGKDDPVAIIRTQGMFPAPEEVVEPYMLGHYVTGDARGSHVMPIMPVPIKTPVAGAYCIPIVSCLAFSLSSSGHFSVPVDMFGNLVWDATRHKIAAKAEDFRRQGFFGVAMASQAELAYTGIVDTVSALNSKFKIRSINEQY